MYDFIFVFFLQLNEKLRSNDPKYHAIAFVILTMIFHVLFVSALIEVGTTFTFRGIFGAHTNKYSFVPGALLFIVIIYRIYSKREELAIRKYGQRNLLTKGNSILVASLFFIPLICGILILKNVKL